MRLVLTIDSDNDGCSSRDDIASLVVKVGKQITHGAMSSKVLDKNGNTVGEWKISGEEQDDDVPSSEPEER